MEGAECCRDYIHLEMNNVSTISCRPLDVMANAGVEYMVSESQGSNPVPLDYLSWVPLTDFVAI